MLLYSILVLIVLCACAGIMVFLAKPQKLSPTTPAPTQNTPLERTPDFGSPEELYRLASTPKKVRFLSRAGNFRTARVIRRTGCQVLLQRGSHGPYFRRNISYWAAAA